VENIEKESHLMDHYFHDLTIAAIKKDSSEETFQ
jgi:hypothetical protein